MKSFFAGKEVLVTGGTGLIGIPLVSKLAGMDAKVSVASLDRSNPFGKDISFQRGDLCDREFCERVMKNAEIVFHLAGIKGGIGVAQSKAATFLVKNIRMNIEVMEAARRTGVEKFLFASSICIYPPAEVFREENAWTGLPHPSDRFGGMAKLIGEMQLMAYEAQYRMKSLLIARPSNTYGPYDNFDPASALIIPALISRVHSGENPLVVWGDGSAVRDFVYSADVAEFLILMMEKGMKGPYNVGSGEGVTVKTVVDIVQKSAKDILKKSVDVEWDKSKPSGEHSRIASIEKAKRELAWAPRTDLSSGISETMKWFHDNHANLPERFSIISEE